MSETKSFSTYKKEELFDQLLNSIRSELLGKEIPKAELIGILDEVRGDLAEQKEQFLAGLSQRYGIPRDQMEKLEGLILISLHNMAAAPGDPAAGGPPANSPGRDPLADLAPAEKDTIDG